MWRPVLACGLTAVFALGPNLSSPARAQDPAGVTAPAPETAPPPSEAPVETRAVDATGFLEQARAFNRFSIESGRLGAERAADADVRAFATRLAEDHLEIERKLAALGSDGTVPKTSEMPDAALIADPSGLLAEIEAAEGGGFDAAFLDAQAEAIGEAMTLFTSFSQVADHAGLRDFAMAALPTLQEHQLAVAELQQ